LWVLSPVGKEKRAVGWRGRSWNGLFYKIKRIAQRGENGPYDGKNKKSQYFLVGDRRHVSSAAEGWGKTTKKIRRSLAGKLYRSKKKARKEKVGGSTRKRVKRKVITSCPDIVVGTS